MPSRNGETATTKGCRFGIWQDLPSVAVARCLSKCGWDFVVLDLQHGPMSWETAYECVHTLRCHSVGAWIRVGIDCPAEVQRALDIGADAVVAPMVNSVKMASLLADAAKYPPQGGRSLGGDCSLYRGDDYFSRANLETKLFVQIEHIEAARNAREMLAIEGIDGCFLGPTDLALSMGLPHDNFNGNEEHRRLVRQSIEACKANGKTACVNCYSREEAMRHAADGFDFVTHQSEVTLLISAGKDLLADLRLESSGSDGPPKPKHPAFARQKPPVDALAE
ncbi:aldolase/citrate lyase family protein [Botrimarina sp.]|uniref:HpcH/HpaI aldolase family protein n=1 Tax=Botrimarina sp. TaxID=2795802 RepID=UPI0032EDA0F8